MTEETEIIDKLFLELSQFTKATTGKEIKLKLEIDELKKRLEAINVLGELKQEILRGKSK